MHFTEKSSQPKLKCFIFSSLIEFADKMTSCAKGVESESKRGFT